MNLAWQGSLWTDGGPVPDTGFVAVRRHPLGADADAWVDFGPGWLAGADDLLAELVASLHWHGQVVPMYERMVAQPRLSARLEGDERPAVVEQMRTLLSERYRVELAAVGANLYRDGADSVAWHGDRVARDRAQATVAIVSLGGPRRFLLRPTGGGPSTRFDLASGDLLVMGGSCQRTWQHSVPKMARAGARASLTFRSIDPAAPTDGSR